MQPPAPSPPSSPAAPGESYRQPGHIPPTFPVRRAGGRQPPPTSPGAHTNFPPTRPSPPAQLRLGFPSSSTLPSPCPGLQREKVSLTAAEARENQPQQPQPRPGRHSQTETSPLLPPPPPPPGAGTAAGRWKKFPGNRRSRRRRGTGSSPRSGFGPCHPPGSAPKRCRYNARPLRLLLRHQPPPPRTGCVCH